MASALNSFATVAMLMLAGCITQMPHAPKSLTQTSKMKVSWSAASEERPYPALLLFAGKADKPESEAKSLFDADAVEALGPPGTDRLQVVTSPSGNTVLVHENASDSSPSEQLTLFFRKTASSPWQVTQVFPPHQPGALYGQYARTDGVDDTYLYHTFPGKKPRRMKLEALRFLPSP